ncbi:MAG: hypothetical protein DI551_11475 [Micavibrio aeruginosavorus]|uniref:Uncharacterized protein n=1 Tax=Micavibrio aeruginosavorus TaxID=349221 RepID=A0A2W5PXI4_9BACT|nr:MAG: hypothetical protein DI551_11475 [Micavibrio aeruginosavorus]
MSYKFSRIAGKNRPVVVFEKAAGATLVIGMTCFLKGAYGDWRKNQVLTTKELENAAWEIVRRSNDPKQLVVT